MLKKIFNIYYKNYNDEEINNNLKKIITHGEIFDYFIKSYILATKTEDTEIKTWLLICFFDFNIFLRKNICQLRLLIFAK